MPLNQTVWYDEMPAPELSNPIHVAVNESRHIRGHAYHGGCTVVTNRTRKGLQVFRCVPYVDKLRRPYRTDIYTSVGYGTERSVTKPPLDMCCRHLQHRNGKWVVVGVTSWSRLVILTEGYSPTQFVVNRSMLYHRFPRGSGLRMKRPEKSKRARTALHT